MKISEKIEIHDPAIIKRAYSLHLRITQNFLIRNKLAVIGILAIISSISYLIITSWKYNRPLSMDYEHLINYSVILFGIIMIISHCISSAFMGQIILDRNPEISREIDLEMSPDGITVSSSFGTGTLTWEYFTRVIASDSIILLYHDENEFRILPAESFSVTDFANLKLLLREHITDYQSV